MAHVYGSHCDCCGLAVDITQAKFCPRCQYPVQPEPEQRFLEVALSDLKRVMRYGGTALSVADLAWRYEGRLQFLHNLKGQDSAQHVADRATQTLAKESPSLPQMFRVPEAAERAAFSVPAPGVARPSVPATPIALHPIAGQVSTSVSPAFPITPAASMRGFSLSSDAVVNILAALGGFFILAGSLSFVLTTSNLWLSFLAVFFLHAIFGVAGQLTRRRLPLLRAVSPLYTLIFALLVPLVGFSAYHLVTNGLVGLSPSALLTLAALYAAAIYILLAVTQRFVSFAYLGIVALLVGDIALAQTLHLAYWWWPCIAMLLALLSLLALPRATGETWPLTENWGILRGPLQVLMYSIISIACLVLPLMLASSLILDSFFVYSLPTAVHKELHLALFLLAGVLFVWFTLWIWRTRRIDRTPLLAYLLVGVLLLLGYALRLDLTGYVLLLSGTALAYHALVRLAGTRLAVYGLPDLTLDQLVIALSVLVMLLVASATPFQLIYRAYAGYTAQNTLVLFFNNSFSYPFVRGSGLALEQLALGVCFLLTLDITAARAGLSRLPTRANWCWLLLLSGLILAAAYGREVLLWQVSPVFPLWAFLALSLALLASAVLVRRFASPAWANPLDVLTLGGIAFTLTLSQSQTWNVISSFLFGFAALLYIVLLSQRRPLPTLLAAGLLLLALPLLLAHPLLVLGLGLLLPLFAASMQRVGLFGKGTAYANLFAWTLFGPAFIYGLALTTKDITGGQSALAGWSALHLTVLASGSGLSAAYEIAALGVAWYATALIARAQLWLVPATLFWLIALLLPTNAFWVLTILTPLLALGAACIERRSRYTWAEPLYLAALCGAAMVAYTGLAQGHLLELSWILLGFAILAYGLGLFTGRLPVLWLTPLFATGAVVVAALLGDLFRPPVVALMCAGLGIVCSRSSRLSPFFRRQYAPLLYALPLYATALAAALLTGIYGTVGAVGNINRPFYGALPTALFLYAVVAFVVLLIEQKPSWNWLVVGFACWAVLLAQHLTPTYMLGAGVGLVLLGLLSGRFFRPTPASEGATRSDSLANFTWNWPWYIAFLFATFVLGGWSYAFGQSFAPDIIAPVLLVFTLLATVVMLVERAPEFLVFPVGMAAWTLHLWLLAFQPAVAIVAYTLLCILIFATQFIWRRLPAATGWLPETGLHNAFSLGGLCVVVLSALNQGALSTNNGALAQAGVFALVTLSLLLFLYGLARPAAVARALFDGMSELERTARLEAAHAISHWCAYSAGLLLSLAVSWEMLAAFDVTHFDVLTLVPASYLLVIAPFLLRDKALPERRFVGQAVALLGAALLLLPALWFGFQGTEVLPSLILLAEALLLLVLGLLARLRIFILSSTGLIIPATLRVLFLSISLAVPILLMVFGSLLVLLATVLILSRHRLQVAWSSWE
ncbi:MAG: hypothetical protein ABI234_19840 [Ktedonobacteraceae bacterium]